MSIKKLYDYKYDESCHGWQVKDYFGSMYRSGRLEEAVKKILNKEDYCIDSVQCRFPDISSYDDYDHFDGVEFEMGLFSDGSEIRVSEEECLSFIKEAVLLYEKKHPDRKGFLDESFERTMLGR